MDSIHTASLSIPNPPRAACADPTGPGHAAGGGRATGNASAGAGAPPAAAAFEARLQQQLRVNRQAADAAEGAAPGSTPGPAPGGAEHAASGAPEPMDSLAPGQLAASGHRAMLLTRMAGGGAGVGAQHLIDGATLSGGLPMPAQAADDPIAQDEVEAGEGLARSTPAADLLGLSAAWFGLAPSTTSAVARPDQAAGPAPESPLPLPRRGGPRPAAPLGASAALTASSGLALANPAPTFGAGSSADAKPTDDPPFTQAQPITPPLATLAAGPLGHGGLDTCAALSSSRTSEIRLSSDASSRASQLDMAPDHARFPAAVSQQVRIWVRDGVQEAQLQLHPAELGPVSVQIALQGQAAHIEFHAAHAATRHALEAALPSLASSLREAGFTLSGGGVFQQAFGQSPQQPGSDGGPGARRLPSQRLSAPPELVARVLRPRGLVDLVA